MKREEKRRPPGYENGDPFIRRCPVCKRATMARGLVDSKKRELAQSFANAHYRHFRDAGGGNIRRCVFCGISLLFDHRCPVHVYEERIEWTPELAQAYRDVVDSAAAGGVNAVLPWGQPEYVLAYRLARLWGLRDDIREPVEGVA